MKLSIRFDSEFDFFRKRDIKNKPFEFALDRRTSVKDLIESLRVPHTEVGEIRFNGHEVGFDHIPDSDGELSIKAISAPFRVNRASFLRPDPLDAVRFVADVNVIRLGRLLILLGFDVRYDSSFSDEEIADRAGREKRIVLTRDTDLLKRKAIVFGRRVRADLPYDQVVEVVRFFGLESQIDFFSRCTACSMRLTPVDKQTVLHLLEPKTKQYYETFFQCPGCRRVFWKGSHHDNLLNRLKNAGILINH